MVQRQVALVGAAFFLSDASHARMFKLPSQLSIFSAELVAIREGLKYSLSQTASTINIISDSKSALMTIKATKYNDKIGPLELEIFQLIFSAFKKNKMITLSWTKGHSSSHGNEIADLLAKRASLSRSLLSQPIPW